jgi:hypothetical protein
MTSRPAVAGHAAALLTAAGLLCGCSLLPQPAASPPSASPPAPTHTAAGPRPAAAPPLAAILPFPPARLQAAAALAGRFTAAWDSWSWQQPPAAWLARLRPMAASSLYPALAATAGTPGVLAHRKAARQTAAAITSALQIRDLAPGSVTISVTVRQVITSPAGTSQATASFAVTLTPRLRGSGWVVWDIEPASAGNN